MTRLSDLVEVNPSEAPLEAGPVSFISMANVDASDATATPRVVARPEDGGTGRRTARPGDVLFARISPSMENGKVAIVPPLATDTALVSGELWVLRPKPGVDSRLVWAFLRQQSVRRELRTFMTGSAGQQRLSVDVLERLDVGEPSSGTWKAAAEALEHLDNARRLCRKLSELARNLPAAVAWDIGGTARRQPLGELDAEFRYGTSERSVDSGVVPVLRIPNVVRGSIDMRDARYMSGPGQADLRLEPGDVLVVRTNGNPERLGRAAVYEGTPEPATFASYLIRIRSKTVDSNFLWAWLQTTEARATLLGAARTTTGQYNLNVDSLRRLLIPRLDPDSEEMVGSVAGHARRMWMVNEAQLALLDRILHAHLNTVFATQAWSAPIAHPQREVAAADYMPTVFAAASERQRQLWERIVHMHDGFRIGDLTADEAERAFLQHSLTLLEQIGLVVRDRMDHTDRWRPPEVDMELLK